MKSALKALLIPIGSAGDVFPFIGIGEGLRRRGHEVTVLTNGYFEKAIRETGLEFAPLGTVDEFLETIQNPDIWHPRKGFRTVARMIARHQMLYDLIEEQYVPGETVIVAHTLALAARVGQDRCGWPVVTVHPTPMLFRSLHEMPTMMANVNLSGAPRWVKRLLWWAGDRFMIDRFLAGPLNEFRRTLGLGPVHRVLREWIHSPLLSIGMFPEWFGARQPDWAGHWRAAGFPLFDRPGGECVPEGLERFWGEGAAPVVFTPGSAMVHGRSFFEAAVEACGRIGRRGLFLTRFAEQLPRELPRGIEHFSFAPLSRILPRCAAIVHHGGIGTMSAALAAGVPQVIMPMSHDQPDNAARIRRLGVGSWLPPRRFRAEALAGQLEELLGSAEVRGKCREAAELCRQGDSIGRMCDWIEGVGLETLGDSTWKVAVGG